MMTLGMTFIVGLLCWFHQYTLAFWILVFAILNGAFGAARAALDPGWYYKDALAAGVEPNYTMLFVTKGITIAILVPIAWYVGKLAGFF